MGGIRTLLAISVLVTHSDRLFGFELLNGDMAITCFFMISGFLMALILDRKYDSRGRFYLNRALRIYPPYFAALALSLVVFAGIDSARHGPLDFLEHLREREQWAGLALAALANLTLIGVDLTRYLSFAEPSAALQFPALLFPEGAGAHNLLLVPQSWTLALELEFYLLAPFLVRLGTLRLAALAAGLFALRHFLVDRAAAGGFDFDPGAAFPLVLGYFLCGVLAYRGYRLYRGLALAPALRRRFELACLLLAAVLVLLGRDLMALLPLPYDGFYLLFAALLPGLFAFSEGRRWDAWLGEFSYPVYLFHFALAQLLYWHGVPEGWAGELTLLSTLLLSAAYIYAVDRPLQRLRARIAAGPGARREPRVVEVPAR